MLSNAQEKLIRSLHTKKGREKTGLCLVEGHKVVSVAGGNVDFVFTPDDTKGFNRLVTTEAPQNVAAVARIPSWSLSDVEAEKSIIVLDGVQDPGNVGSILRLCLGFHGSLVLIESADVTNPKVIRSSVGAMFQVPWVTVSRDEAPEIIRNFHRPVYRLERSNNAQAFDTVSQTDPLVFIAGSEGTGIHLPIEGIALTILHDPKLESLNVGHALAIVLSRRI